MVEIDELPIEFSNISPVQPFDLFVHSFLLFLRCGSVHLESVTRLMIRMYNYNDSIKLIRAANDYFTSSTSSFIQHFFPFSSSLFLSFIVSCLLKALH